MILTQEEFKAFKRLFADVCNVRVREIKTTKEIELYRIRITEEKTKRRLLLHLLVQQDMLIEFLKAHIDYREKQSSRWRENANKHLSDLDRDLGYTDITFSWGLADDSKSNAITNWYNFFSYIDDEKIIENPELLEIKYGYDEDNVPF